MRRPTRRSTSLKPWHATSRDIIQQKLDGVEKEVLDLKVDFYTFLQLNVILFTRKYFGNCLDERDPKKFKTTLRDRCWCKYFQRFVWGASPEVLTTKYMEDYLFLAKMCQKLKKRRDDKWDAHLK